jgi:hypothetical protein
VGLETQVHKITNVPVFYMPWLDLMILMRANPLLGQLEWVGPENLEVFKPKWHSLRSLPFQGQKSLEFQGLPFQ